MAGGQQCRLLIHTHRQRAIAIWQQLLTNQEPDVAAAASQALENLQKHSSEADLQASTTATRTGAWKHPGEKLLRRRLLERDGMTSTSWHPKVIQLRQKRQDIWDFEHRQHQLFLELANERLNHLENTLMERP